MAGYIFIDKDSDSGMRSNMRRAMRDGSYRHEGYSPMMRDEKEHWYKKGYEHGWEDSEDDMEMRRARDSRGRFV